MEYKIIPAPLGIKASGPQLGAQAANAYAALLNEQAGQGWEFVCFDATTVTEVVCGCCDGNKMTIKLVVFRRGR